MTATGHPTSSLCTLRMRRYRTHPQHSLGPTRAGPSPAGSRSARRVGTEITPRPPHRSGLASFSHPAASSQVNRKSEGSNTLATYWSVSRRNCSEQTFPNLATGPIFRGHFTIRRQCQMLNLARSGVYRQPEPANDNDLEAIRRIDSLFTQRPFFGARRIAKTLSEDGFPINRKRVRRLMRRMGIEALGPKPRTTKPAPGHKIYPYLLRDLKIERPGHVWAADITYIPIGKGFLYLVAVIDWASRAVLSWRLSNTVNSDKPQGELRPDPATMGRWLRDVFVFQICSWQQQRYPLWRNTVQFGQQVTGGTAHSEDVLCVLVCFALHLNGSDYHVRVNGLLLGRTISIKVFS